MKENAIGRLSIKNDFIFKKLFSTKGNEKYLEEFLSELLKIKIREIEITHDVALEKNIEKDKLGVLDIKAVINQNININIEMQRGDEKNIIPRTTVYGAKMVNGQLKKKENYKILKPVVVIVLMDFNYFKSKRYITKTITVATDEREEEINRYVTYYYIELEKFRKSKKNMENKLTQWLVYIDGEEKEKMKEAIKKNKVIKEADKELEYLSGDEETRRLAELRDKYYIDMASAKSSGYDEGIEKGLKKGKKEGKIEGKKEEKTSIARNMLNRKVNINFIASVTGLKVDEINKLK